MSHQQIFHGDTLRTILSFVNSHRELAQLRNASRSLLHDASKSIIWPRHLLEIALTSPDQLRRHAQSSYIADLVRGVDLTRFEPRHKLSVEDLSRFPQLHSIHLNLEDQKSDINNEHRKIYELVLFDWLAAAGATIENVDINVGLWISDYRYYVQMLSLLPAMTHLRINHKNSRSSYPAWVFHHSGVTPESCHALRKIVIDLEQSEHGPHFGSKLGDLPPSRKEDEIYQHYQVMMARFDKTDHPPHIQIRARAFRFDPTHFDCSIALIEAAIEWQCVHLTSISIEITGDGSVLPTADQVQRYLIAYDRLYQMQPNDPPQLVVHVTKALSSFASAMQQSSAAFFNRPLTHNQYEMSNGCIMRRYMFDDAAADNSAQQSRLIFIWWEPSTSRSDGLGRFYFNYNIKNKSKSKVTSQSYSIQVLNEMLEGTHTALSLQVQNADVKNVWMNGLQELFMMQKVLEENVPSEQWIAVHGMSNEQFAYLTPLLASASILELHISDDSFKFAHAHIPTLDQIMSRSRHHSLGSIINALDPPSHDLNFVFHESFCRAMKGSPKLYHNTVERFIEGIQYAHNKAELLAEQIKDEPKSLDNNA